MGITRISSNDTGAGYTIRIDAGNDGSIAVLSSAGGDWISRFDEGGARTLLAAAPATYNELRYGDIETLSDGRYVVHVSASYAYGGSRLQILNANGTAATDVVNPMFEDQDRSGLGYTIAATLDGGFAFVWNDSSRASDSFTGTQPPYLGNSSFTSNAGNDVRVRYFDDDAVASGPSTVADDDVETVNGATISRRALDQYIYDSTTLADGKIAFVFMDNRWVGHPQYGRNDDWQVSLQISAPGSVGEPIKADIRPLDNDEGGQLPDTLDPGVAALNVIALPNGTLAVIWTEKTYVPDSSVWGGYAYSGTQTVIRYFSATGEALTGAIPLVTRGTEHGNHSTFVWGEALPDGRIAIGYNIGVYGVNGNGKLDAFVGVVGVLGSSVAVTQVNPTAQNTQAYTIQDLAVRSDGTIDLVYNDASVGTNGNNRNVTLIDRFLLTGAGETGQVGGAGGDSFAGGDAAEVMFGLGGNDTLNGGGGIDALHGGDGNDGLNGGTGADRMFGGAGDDSFTVDNVGDKVVELSAQGADTVRANIGYTLGDHVENLILTGGAAINGNGNALANSLTGNGAANRLDGKAGADAMAGGLGHDVYVVDNLGDTVTEGGSSGTDTVESSVDFRLPTHVEKLILTGTAGRFARGNSGDNNITGNSGANTINGSGGDDVIDAGGGNDLIYGSAGNDSLKGGAGLDRFLFNTALGTTNVDKILDFYAPSDTINLDRAIFTAAGPNGTLGAAAFRQGSAAGDASDRIVYEASTGKIFYDADGAGGAAQILFATVTAGTPLTNADFVIYG